MSMDGRLQQANFNGRSRPHMKIEMEVNGRDRPTVQKMTIRRSALFVAGLVRWTVDGLTNISGSSDAPKTKLIMKVETLTVRDNSTFYKIHKV